MSMKLFYSPNSPYARKCRVLIIEKGLETQVEQHKIDVLAEPQPVELISANPLGRVPALITDDNLALCDSPLIVEYLDGLPSDVAPMIPQEKDARLRVLALAALADGIMEATVTLYLQKRRSENLRWPDWMARKRQAILRTLEYVNKQGFLGDSLLDLGTISLACSLSYLHLRHPDMQWEHTYPELDKWLAHVLKRPSFEATAPVP